MSRLTLIRTTAFALVLGAAGTVFAADSLEAEKTRQDVVDASRKAGEISREATNEGKRVARDATDFAKDVADSFSDGWDQEKKWD